MKTLSFLLLALVPLALMMADIVTGENGTESERTAIDRGLKPVYTMTNFFLDLVRSSDEKEFNKTIKLIQDITSGKLSSLKYEELLLTYIGYTICAAVGVLFILLMPLVGCIVCCCRCCCNKCGGHHQDMEGKHAKCQRVVCGLLLAVFTTLMLGGMVCAFLTNEQMYSQTKLKKNAEEEKYGALQIIQAEFSNLDTFIEKTVEEIDSATLGGFNRTVDEIISKLQGAGKEAQNFVGELTNATSLLSTADKLAERVDVLARNLGTMDQAITDLQSNATSLQTALSSVRSDISTTLNSSAICNSSLAKEECAKLTETLKNLDIQTDFTLEGVESTLKDALARIKEVQNQNITGLVDKAQGEYDKIKKTVSSSTKDGIKQAEEQSSKIYSEAAKMISTVKDTVKGFSFGSFGSTIGGAEKDIATYGNYRWYAGIGLSGVLALIVLFYYLGLAVGVCGERPGSHARTCNKGVGANLLMAGVGFSFLFSWLLMLVTLILFLGGGLLYTEVCRSLVNENQRMKVASLADSFIPIKNFSVANTLKECKGDSSAYEAFHLSSFMNLDDVLDVKKYNLTGAFDISINLPQIKILTQELEDQLGDLGNSSLDNINTSKILNEARQEITKIDLNAFANNLTTFSKTTGINLTGNAVTLRQIQENQVTTMEGKVDELEAATNEVKKSADIKSETDNLLEGIKKAENSVNNNGTTYVNQKVKNTTGEVEKSVESFASGLKMRIRKDIGKCRPIYDALNHVIDGACVYVLEPFNGFWYCFGWCLFFFIPCIVLAVNLVGLYRRTEKYDPSQLGGVDYDDYEGVNPGDTIPLDRLDQHKLKGVSQGGNVNGGYNTRGDYPRSTKPEPYYPQDEYRGPNMQPANGYGDYRGGYHAYVDAPRPTNQYAQQHADESLNHSRGYPGPHSKPPSYRAPEPPQYHGNRYGGQRW